MVAIDFTARCVVCGKVVDEECYRRQEAVSAVGPEGTVTCCARHLSEDGPGGPGYAEAVKLMAEAKAAQLRREGVS